MAKQPKLGSGLRFKKLANSIAKKGSVSNPGEIAAMAGRRKFGNKKFQELAIAGKRRHAREG